ncbi:MAG: AAA family ATPase [Acidobacteria bacterium]|nr:MAG: AAA family ATPase [Acidobacteriota bacterium]
MEFAPLPELPGRAVVLMIGLPGSGKSSYLAHYGLSSVSTDALRELLFGDAAEQRAAGQVFGLLYKVLTTRLEVGVPQTFIDATNLDAAARKPLVRIAKEAGIPAIGLWLDADVDECQARSQLRGRVVELEVIQRFARKLRPPTAAEGIDHLYRVRGSVGEWVY